MHPDGQDKQIRVLRTAAEILLLGGAYFLFLSITHLGIPCPIRAITGYYCPGCGISHLFLALMHLDFAGARSANPFVFYLLPFGILYAVYRSHVYIRDNRQDFSVPETVILAAVLAGAIIFAVVRNMT